MKKISVKNFKGEEFEGMWNEKTYSSKIDGRPDLYRIYLDGESIHDSLRRKERKTRRKRA